MSSDASNSLPIQAERDARFLAEAHRQSRAAAESASERDDQAFIDAISEGILESDDAPPSQRPSTGDAD